MKSSMHAPYTGFESVYRRELPFVWAAARRLGVHPAAIDDAVQDVFLTAYRRWGDLHEEVSPRAWLYGVTRRVAFRYRRSEARTLRRKAAVAHAGPIAGASPAPQRDRDEARDVSAVLAVLEPARREVFVMADLLDMSGPEIAAQLRIPLNTVYSRLRLARRELEPRLRRGVGAWVGGVRKRDEPPPEQAQRTWAVLALRLVGSPGGGVLGAWTTARVVMGVLAVGLLTAAAIAGRPAPRGSARAEHASRPVANPAAVAKREREREREPEPQPEPSVAGEDDAHDPAAARLDRVDVVEPVEVPRSTRARGSAPARSPVVAPAVVAPVAPAVLAPAGPERGLAEEVAVLDRATEALREGNAAHAMQWLAEHERQFSTGRLVDVRKATRVRALCKLGRDAEARAEAQALRRDHPRSAVARQAPRSCDEQ